MPTPIRNVSDAPPGAITATPRAVLNKLAIRVLKVRGVKSQRRGRR